MCSTWFLFFILGLVVLLLALQCELPCERAAHGLQLTKLTRRDPRGADPCAGQNFRPQNLAEPYFCRVNDSPCFRVFLDSDFAESVPLAAAIKKVYLKTLQKPTSLAFTKSSFRGHCATSGLGLDVVTKSFGAVGSNIIVSYFKPSDPESSPRQTTRHSTLFLTSQLHLAELWEMLRIRSSKAGAGAVVDHCFFRHQFAKHFGLYEPFWVEGQPWKINAELGDFGKIV
ncbi:uncharacterized protein EV420DRAFT_1481696 [Desarmillaria tabescens]|uniref:Uncharacterized protein n=1 Tax=Armillaria tabescens TaxID=1929756 RepID=A0AA39N1T0_ARMTA|nr:uncharacterized protein EV420DRAFT_1481696 [Desarmillaria tabescens]KAK0454264.1 hypothetical protein EV420DRAFT_1481696 [Desarmillaria tabescens]